MTGSLKTVQYINGNINMAFALWMYEWVVFHTVAIYEYVWFSLAW